MKLNTKDRKKFRIRNRLIKNNPNNRMRLTVSRSSKNICRNTKKKWNGILNYGKKYRICWKISAYKQNN